ARRAAGVRWRARSAAAKFRERPDIEEGERRQFGHLLESAQASSWHGAVLARTAAEPRRRVAFRQADREALIRGSAAPARFRSYPPIRSCEDCGRAPGFTGPRFVSSTISTPVRPYPS